MTLPRSICRLLAATVALAAGTVAAPGQIPPGMRTYSFARPALWDFSGNYAMQQESSTVYLSLRHESNGRIAGTRREVIEYGSDRVEANAEMRGRTIRSARTVGYASAWKTVYSGSFQDRLVTANVAVTAKSLLMTNQPVLQAKARSRLCVVGGGCERNIDVRDMPLDLRMNGSWVLAMDIGESFDGRRLTGTATLTLSNGRSLSYLVSGRHNSRKGTSTLNLTGAGEAIKSRFTLLTQYSGLELMRLNGSVLGQRVKITGR